MILHDNDALLITTITNSNYMLGDINADEEINILDVVLIVDVVLNGGQNNMSDLNNDSIVNILDVILLVNIILDN